MENAEVISFLKDLILKDYDIVTAQKIFDGFKCKKVTTFRVNTIKTSLDLVLKILDENKLKYQVYNQIPNAVIYLDDINILKSLDIYVNGKIYLQSLSSMLPPLVLEPKKNFDIIDMCSAPGGKTCEIASLANNECHIVAVEKDYIRSQRLKYNLDLQGVKCATVMNINALDLDDYFMFDQVLLDAPCSGSGTYTVENKKISKLLIKNSVTAQIALLKKASRIVKKGGTIIYSTCSVLKEENEEVLNKILKDGRLRIDPITTTFDAPLLPTTIDGVLCVMPNEYFEGFFVAKLIKVK